MLMMLPLIVLQASLALLEEESHENYNPMNEYKKSIDIVHLQPNVSTWFCFQRLTQKCCIIVQKRL